MAVGFVQELDASRCGQTLKAPQNIRAVPFQLVEDHPGEGKSDPEGAAVFLNQLKQKGAGGKIAFLCDAVQYPAVLRLVLIVVERAHVEEAVPPKTAGLVDLKVETDARHSYSFRI
jgi:hypothetical protein